MWLSEELAPDRFSVARDGYLVSGTWYEVDLLDEVGGFAGEDLDIFLASNVAWMGPDPTNLALQGPALE